MNTLTASRVLNVGAGGQQLADWRAQGFEVVNLDISPDAKPDICADMCDMGEVGEFEAIFSSHSLEHLYPHEVQKALKEFYRILKPQGYVTIIVPDLEGVRPDNTVLGYSDSGPITGLHLFYGDPRKIPVAPYMAHHCGFIAETLAEVLTAAGFSNVSAKRLFGQNLIGVGQKA